MNSHTISRDRPPERVWRERHSYGVVWFSRSRPAFSVVPLRGVRAPAPCGRGSFSSGVSPTLRTGLVQMASDHHRSNVVTPEALEEARRNVWVVLNAHGWKPEQDLDKHIAETLMVLAKMGVTDTRELLRRTLDHFELAPIN